MILLHGRCNFEPTTSIADGSHSGRSLFLSIQNYQQGVWVEKRNLHGHSFTCTAIQLFACRNLSSGSISWEMCRGQQNKSQMS